MYCFDSIVRYSEIDSGRHMTLSGILDLLQDSCIFHSEDLGMGLDFLQEIQRAWVLSFWQVIINRYPKLGERVHAYTWPYDFKNFLGWRNFKLEDESGGLIACANSIWTFLDTDKQCPARIPQEIADRYSYEPPFEMKRASRKIPLEEDMQPKAPLCVGRSCIDTNMHVNNGKYIMMAEEYLPEGFKVHELRAEYKKAAVLSDIICPNVKVKANQVLVSLENEAGEAFAIVEFMEDNI